MSRCRGSHESVKGGVPCLVWLYLSCTYMRTMHLLGVCLSSCNPQHSARLPTCMLWVSTYMSGCLLCLQARSTAAPTPTESIQLRS